jgi:Rps23 Pro-64 3,4-dihydroxylase Tpa1-like proline 4-hydroxylase
MMQSNLATAMHVDFNQHEVTRLDNRLVFITYLNKDWLPAYGGALELWSAEEEKYKVEVLPVFGRSVLFAHSSRSLHCYPAPVSTRQTDVRGDPPPLTIIRMALGWRKHRLPHHNYF